MKRVLVTGAGGFLGSYVTRTLLQRGLDVAVLVRGNAIPERLDGLDPRMIQGDLSGDGWITGVQSFKPDVLVHMAWRGVAGGVRNDAVQAGNIQDMAKLLEVARACGTQAFIGAGSQAEYGAINRLCSETNATAPTTLYGQAKLDACRMGERFCGEAGIRFAWLRIFSTYGPGDNPHWMIPYLIGELLAGRMPQLTACEQRWDFLHARDAAQAFACVALEETARGVFNLGSGQAPVLRETVETIRDLIDPALALGFGAVAYRQDQVMHLQADSSRLTKALGWTPAISLADGLKETVRWYAKRK